MSKKVFNLLLAGAILFRVVVSFLIWHPDLNNHVDWGIRFFEYGTKAFYAPESNVWSYTWPNQPPGTMYMFAGVRKLFEFVFNIVWQINIKVPAFPSVVVSYFETNLYPALLKLPAILCDLGISYLIIKITKKNWLGLVWLYNPVVFYNSAVWGQYDAVINFFGLLSFYLLTKKKLLFSMLLMALSFYIKASLLIFAPIWFVFALTQRYKLKDWAVSALVVTSVIFILTLPFSKGNVFVWLYELYTKKIFVAQLHVITANAFNIWATIAGIHERPDSLPFLLLNYKTWGTLLFGIFYIPLLVKLYKNKNEKTLFYTLALAAFSSFILMTNMHERYLYPLFPYLTILLGLTNLSFWYYLGVSLISLLNLYNFWFTPKVSIIVDFLSFGDRLTPRVLGLILTILYLRIYSRYNELK